MIYQRKTKFVMKMGAAFIAFTVMNGNTAMADVGDRVQLEKSAAIYYSANDAKKGTNQAGKYSQGNYYIFKENNSTGTINITDKKGVAGAWIKKSLVKSTTTSTANTTNSSQTSKLSLSGTTTGRVNFRSKPASNSSSISKIPAGTKLQAAKQDKNWFKVEYKGKIGYIHSSLFSLGGSKSTQTTFKHPLPSNCYVVTSEFAYRIHPITGKRTHHDGIDLAADKGTTIYAMAAGTVTASSYGSISGNFVRIQHTNGLETFYAHMSKRAVAVGSKISKGAVVGYVGTTGGSTGNHLHFEIRKNGVKLNPRSYFKF